METICLNEYNDLRINIERVFIYKKMQGIIGVSKKVFYFFWGNALRYGKIIPIYLLT